MNRLIQRTVPLVLLALMAALAGLLFLTDTDAAGPAKFRTNIACNPLSSAQVAAGTSQTCTIRVINVGGAAAENVTAYRFGGWTVNTVQAWKRVKLPGSGGSVFSFDGVSCAGPGIPECSAASLGPGDSFFIQITSTRPASQDGIGLSEGCSLATGVPLNCVPERRSLP